MIRRSLWLLTSQSNCSRCSRLSSLIKKTFSDPSSASDPNLYSTTHMKFDWSINFSESTVSGRVILKMTKLCINETPILNLDVNNLNINSIFISGVPADFKIIPSVTKALGSRLEITNTSIANEFDVEIVYQTSPDSRTLQWFRPEQTVDKRLPFMFSQCQPIHARGLFPCQDTPAVRATFEAMVRVPKDVVVVMSAIQKGVTSLDSSSHEEFLQFRFEQSVPIPSYLVTLACGDLVSRRIGPRTSVWAAQSLVDRAADEFAETEQMLSVAENLCGPYIWRQYDILVLPTTFPYGAMENPCLTFVSPTVLTGDRSQVHVITHEIVHSWTGNSVTNASWEHYWLNEGHTVYLERLVLEKLYGTDMRQLLLANGYTELIIECNEFGAMNPLTKLVQDLDGVDPDVAYSTVPYEKGSLLLFFLECKLGKEKVLSWLRHYIAEHTMQCVDTTTWLQSLTSYFGFELEVQQIDWNEWFYGCGLPSWKPRFAADEAIRQCNHLTDLFYSSDLATGKEEVSSYLLEHWNRLTSIQQELALRRTSERSPLPYENIHIIESILHLSTSCNAELRFEWSLMCIRARYAPVLDNCFEFLNSQGRMRYTRPLYKHLYDWPEIRNRVLNNFRAQRPLMHQTTAALVARDLELDERKCLPASVSNHLQ